MKKNKADRFFLYLDKIVHITIIKIKRNETESASKFVDQLLKIFERFLKLKETNPYKFETLLFSKEFYEKYVIPIKDGSYREFNNTTIESREKIFEDGRLLLEISDEPILNLKKFFNAFENIWKVAVETENEEISIKVINNIKEYLFQVTRSKENYLIVREILRLLDSLTFFILERYDSINIKMYYPINRWYLDTLFYKRIDEESFNLNQLKLFNEFYFYSLLQIIKQNKIDLFKSHVRYFIDGVFYLDRVHDLWDYFDVFKYDLPGDFDIDLTSEVKKLISQVKNVKTIEDCNLAIRNFENLDLKSKSYRDIDQGLKNTKNEIIESIRNKVKFESVLEIFLGIGAYCYFKSRTEFILFLWYFKQPDDAHGLFTGHNIIPTSLDSVFRIILFDYPNSKKYEFREDHHGSDIYYKKYLLILLIIQITKKKKGNVNVTDLSSVTLLLKSDNSSILSSRKYFMEELSTIIDHISKDGNFLTDLNIKKEDLKDKIETIKKYFIKISEKISSRIEEIGEVKSIDDERVREFKSTFFEAFNKYSEILNIFVENNLYVDNSNEVYEGKIERLGINRVDHKAAFIKDWYIDYSRWGESYAREMNNGKNTHIMMNLLEKSTSIEINKINQVISKSKNVKNLFIITTTVAIYKYFDDSEKFIHHYQISKETPKNPDFIGYYKYRDIQIPVYKTIVDIGKRFFIFDSNRFGTLIQYNPLNKDENEGLKEQIYFMRIISFTEDKEVRDNLLDDAPEWLKEIGDKETQIKYLKSKVLVQIFERFELKLSDNFWGYRVDLK